MEPTQRDYVDTFRIESATVLAAARTIDHERDVPHLPGWTVGDVLAHLVGDYRWALDIIDRRSGQGAVLGRSDRTGSALVDELASLADELVSVLEAADPDDPCPNFTGGGTMRFWLRRQAHETTIHRWDVEVDRRLDTIRPEMAVDGISEVFEVYASRWPGHDVSRPLRLGCDVPASGQGVTWIVSPTGVEGRIRVERTARPGPNDLTATPAELLLLLWGRCSLARLEGARARPDRVGEIERLLAGPLTA